MAKWIPEGTEYISGPVNAQFTIETDNLKLINQIQKNMTESPTNPISIGRHKFYIPENTLFIQPGKIKAEIKLIPVDASKIKLDKLIVDLRKFGPVSSQIDRDIHSYVTRGYLKHEFSKKKLISENKKHKKFIQIQDILPDKDGNMFEVCELDEYIDWCDSCQDEHTMTDVISKALFKTKKEALKKYNQIK